MLIVYREHLFIYFMDLLTSFCFFPQWAVPFMILIVSIKSNLIISYLVSVAAGVSVAAAFLLPW